MLLKMFFNISFSNCLLPIHRNTINFCMLTLHLAAFLIHLLTLIDSLFWVFCKQSCHLWIMVFFYSFPILIAYISFSCLKVISRTSGTMLHSSGYSAHPFLLFLGKYPTEMHIVASKDMYKDVHSNIIHYRPKLKQSIMSINKH